MSYQNKAQDFLKIAKEFKLGRLPTETPHPKTNQLSYWANNDIQKALEVILDIELELVEVLKQQSSKIYQLSQDIKKCFDQGGKVVLCGCGATGRLSLALETIWRHDHADNDDDSKKNFVESFMAGGDVALIHSIENFEDFPEYGARQLHDMNFSKNDLLISCTEGGETPFVIGATEEATRISSFNPYFLYCNPDDILKEVATRSKNVIENSKINKINLSVGPMVLAGSTRMQASTILMAAVGIALNTFGESQARVDDFIQEYSSILKDVEFSKLANFVEEESQIYKEDKFLLYECEEDYGISVLTDTTERAPTFSLHSFENVDENNDYSSLSYLWFSHIEQRDKAWNNLLMRSPRPLEWEDTKHLTGASRLNGFAFNNEIKSYRDSRIENEQEVFKIVETEAGIEFNLRNEKHTFKMNSQSFLLKHLLLKVLLNTHSTLVMGRLGRYKNNIMTWVRPSNNKLIDRAVRYTDYLLKEQDIEKSYDELVYEIFKQMEGIARDDSIVLRMMESLEQNN